ncbi:MAG: PIN domain-containing protein [Desulfobacteraceae bacterium]|nr:MAG: PIN domain-containing protein [Desulfobacteraceae bacterium]
MIDKKFLDTNVIVYAYDSSAGEKHQLARTLLVEMWDSGAGVISTQVLQEFFVTVTRKISRPLSTSVTADIISDFLTWEVIVNDGRDILDAIAVQQKEKISFWDALIIASAQKAGCYMLYSEDLNPGQRVNDLTIINPFV